ncbi:hypothetical protein SAMN05421819_3590 [Bryocella elongata]|uniref:Outer membrane protein beta-barrel domain-containing protein n=1 Tax=Bryocella elongata TaxID=863522 RepID=A0A1H6B8I8_9BACT|nr:hypothetical protein [Bryocella elongata]SEG56735.1 hypothetical protein SAMN05421819_3590 [Bryocella elongata]
MPNRIVYSLVFLFSLLSVRRVAAQTDALRRHEEVEGYFSSLAYLDNSKYIGGGAEYTWAPRRWIGAGAGVTASDSTQVLRLTSFKIGEPLTYAYGFVRSGWTFKRFGVYGVVAGGRTTVNGFNGIDENLNPTYGNYSVPTFAAGGKFEIAVTRRLTLNYEAFDKLQFGGDSTFHEPASLGGSYVVHGLTEQTQEIRAGLGFHF